MRTFLAIEFPPDIRQACLEVAQELEDRLHGLRWVQPECIHLTLRFLGEIAEEVAVALETPTRAAVAEVPIFHLSLGEPGSFGSARAPQVFWVAVREGAARLEELRSGLDSALTRAGLAPDTKTWAPHVTLARRHRRARDAPGADIWKDALRATSIPGLGFDVTSVTMLSSRLTPSGPVYTPVWTVPLRRD